VPVYNHYYPDAANLINTPDSAARLVSEGPTVPVAVAVPPSLVTYLEGKNLPVPTPVTGRALIDTGASVCMVDESVVQSFNLPPFGVQTIHGAGGTAQQATYPASLSFPGTTLPNLSFIDFIAGPLQATGIIAIIGRNVLSNFVLIYNGPGGSVSLAY
jgi:predicted aspartyl protease